MRLGLLNETDSAVKSLVWGTVRAGARGWMFTIWLSHCGLDGRCLPVDR
ncbi:hypothetical protein FHS20_003591 [Phyllobacterium endophyticum]|nr:hypothetical protein [Phyllobacterium endophyticum]